jgi:4-amino-4-deoxy-L-arabinose transferase-like glycosyltransferase
MLVLIIAAIAVIVRFLHVYFITKYNPLAYDLTLDAAVYDRWARALISGGGGEPTRLMQSPLFPWFLAMLYRIFGPSLTAVRLAQAVLGTLSCALVAIITRRFFASTAAAAVAGIIAALYMPSMFYEGVLVSVTLILFLNLLFILLLTPGASAPGRGDPGTGASGAGAADSINDGIGAPGTARLFLAGVVLGLSVTAKPLAILLLPFAMLHLGVNSAAAGSKNTQETKRSDQGRPRSLARAAAALAAGLVIALLPLIIRNASLSGEFIPFTTGGGINFYIGNNPKANGFYAVPTYRGRSLGGTPEEQWRSMHDIASEETGRALGPSEVSRFWLVKGLEYVRDHPARSAALTWRKFLFFWNGYERASVENMSFHRRFVGVLQLPFLTFGILAPLALLGVFATRDRWRSLWLLYGGIVTYLAAALIFYVLSRYRMPVVAFLIPFAGAGLVELWRLVVRRRIGELVMLVAAIALLSYFTNMTVAADTPAGTAGNLVRLGNAYAERGDKTRAMESYMEALWLDPKNSRARKGIEKLQNK